MFFHSLFFFGGGGWKKSAADAFSGMMYNLSTCFFFRWTGKQTSNRFAHKFGSTQKRCRDFPKKMLPHKKGEGDK